MAYTVRPRDEQVLDARQHAVVLGRVGLGDPVVAAERVAQLVHLDDDVLEQPVGPNIVTADRGMAYIGY